jgi:uncharacterized membrane protein YhaH (DUF805 family)
MEGFYTKPNNVIWLLFSFEGRANRTHFWVGHLFFLIVWAVAVGAMWGLAEFLHYYDVASDSDFMIYLVIAFWALLFIVIYLAVWIKRLHDLGAPGGVVLPIYLVPVVLSVASEKWFVGTSLELPLALAFLLAWMATFGFCGVRSGEPEPNEYGTKAGPEFAISDMK